MVSIVAVKLPTGEAPYCGVTLEPYVLIKRGEAVLNAEDLAEEGTDVQGQQFQLRCRWYRSTIPRGGAVCSVHPERESTLQCVICTKCKVATHLSYHCSTDCFKSHWHLHREYHKQQPPSQPNGGGPGGDTICMLGWGGGWRGAGGPRPNHAHPRCALPLPSRSAGERL